MKRRDFYNFEIETNGQGISLGLESCNDELMKVLKATKDEFLDHEEALGHRIKKDNFRFEVYDASGVNCEEKTPEEWEKMKKKFGYMVYFIYVSSESEEDEAYIRLNESDDDPILEKIFVSVEHWAAFIQFLKKYKLISQKQAKELAL
jgi:hypothetical protein